MTKIREIFEISDDHVEEDLFRNFFNLPLVGAAITSQEKGWIDVNHRTCEILGYSREELFKKNWAEITHPDDLAADVRLFQKMLDGEINGYSIEKRFIRGDGKIVWTILSGGKSSSADTKNPYFYVQIIDITEKKLAEIEIINAKNEAENARNSLKLANEQLQKYAEYEIEQSRIKEREKLLEDMHDGFGSQLASVKIMALNGQLPPEQLPVYLDELTQDLHLVVDTLRNGASITLKDALIDLRHRLVKRFNHGPPFIHWHLDLAGGERLADRKILHILRMIQESINNALRHAGSENIWIKVDHDSALRNLTISVIDHGVGLPQVIKPGRGTGNMLRRAREIGAKLEWINLSPGTEVKIVIYLE